MGRKTRRMGCVGGAGAEGRFELIMSFQSRVEGDGLRVAVVRILEYFNQ